MDLTVRKTWTVFHPRPKTKTLSLGVLLARIAESPSPTGMNALELSQRSTGIHTSLDGSPTLPPLRPTTDKPPRASCSPAPPIPLPHQRPSPPNHAPSRPVLPRNPFPRAHPRSAGGLSVPKRNASSTSAQIHMLPSSSPTVSAVHPATSGSASAPTRRTAPFRGMLTARAASRARGTPSIVSLVTTHTKFPAAPTCSAKDPAPPLVAADPDVRKHDGDRVLCKACNSWISVGPEGQAAQAWSQHRAQCKQASPAAPPPPASVTSAASAPKHPRYAAPNSPAVQATERAKMLPALYQRSPALTASASARFGAAAPCRACDQGQQGQGWRYRNGDSQRPTAKPLLVLPTSATDSATAVRYSIVRPWSQHKCRQRIAPAER
jgi:hypothetical protein